jgi:hypothetical protein
MIKVDYMGNNNIQIQYGETETEEMENNIINCFKKVCSWSEDGELVNFNIKKYTQNEILELKKHIEQHTNHTICNENDNEFRIKIKTEYTAKQIIKNIYTKHNKPSTPPMDNIKEETTYENKNENKELIMQESNEENGFEMLQRLL